MYTSSPPSGIVWMRWCLSVTGCVPFRVLWSLLLPDHFPGSEVALVTSERAHVRRGVLIGE